MDDYYIGEIRIFPYTNIPNGWLPCNGQTLSIYDFRNLYALIGTTYGGDDRASFQLPDMRGRIPIGFGKSTILGKKSGLEEVSLTLDQLPSHTHDCYCQNKTGLDVADYNELIPSTISIDNEDLTFYKNPKSQTSTVKLNTSVVKETGYKMSHENRQPSIAFVFCIATSGLYPKFISNDQEV